MVSRLYQNQPWLWQRLSRRLDFFAKLDTIKLPHKHQIGRNGMRKYIPITKPERSPQIDVNSGHLCAWVYWRPNPDDPDPDMPGLNQHMTTFIRAQPDQDCLGGSRKPYSACCRLNRYWHPICPNPGMAGYSQIAWHWATFVSLDRQAIREQLLAEVRVHDLEDTPERSFGTYWGEPELESEFGIMCFGDLELNQDSLLVTTMSELRMPCC
jgi:hypothetical protein